MLAYALFAGPVLLPFVPTRLVGLSLGTEAGSALWWLAAGKTSLAYAQLLSPVPVSPVKHYNTGQRIRLLDEHALHRTWSLFGVSTALQLFLICAQITLAAYAVRLVV